MNHSILEETTDTIPLNDIDGNDTTFLLSYGHSLELLKHSLDRVGLINPPVVRRKDASTVQVVCGHRRVGALRELGASTISCRILPSAMSDRDCFLLNFYDTVSERTCNPIEISLAIRGLLRYYPEEKVVKAFLPELKLHPHKTQFEAFLPLSALEPEIKDALVEGIIDRGSALRLARMGGEDRKTCGRLLITLRLSLSKQVALLEYIAEISLRENISAREVVNCRPVRSLLEDSRLNLPQKGDAVRNYLRKRRYPRLTAREEEFRQGRHALRFPPDIRLKPPAFFEDNHFTLTCCFTSLQRLEQQVHFLETVIADPSLSSMIEG